MQQSYGAIAGPPMSPKGFERAGFAFHARSIAAMVLVPFIMFAILMLTWAMIGYYHFYTALAISALCFVWSMIFLLIHVSSAQQGPMYLFLAILCVMAMQTGIYAGLTLQNRFFMPYWEYSSRPTYTDVTPEDPAASRMDGGIIGFSSNTVVDTLRGASILDSKRTYYCVAPILDESQQGRAEFWAVGVNCCEKHVGFYCDGARDPQAKMGLVVFNTDSAFGKDTYSKYIEAVKIAAATDQVLSPEVPVLVRWITDSESEVNGYWNGGVVSLAISLAIGLIFFLVAAVVLHGLSRVA